MHRTLRNALCATLAFLLLLANVSFGSWPTPVAAQNVSVVTPRIDKIDFTEGTTTIRGANFTVGTVEGSITFTRDDGDKSYRYTSASAGVALWEKDLIVLHTLPLDFRGDVQIQTRGLLSNDVFFKTPYAATKAQITGISRTENSHLGADLLLVLGYNLKQSDKLLQLELLDSDSTTSVVTPDTAILWLHNRIEVALPSSFSGRLRLTAGDQTLETAIGPVRKSTQLPFTLAYPTSSEMVFQRTSATDGFYTAPMFTLVSVTAYSYIFESAQTPPGPYWLATQTGNTAPGERLTLYLRVRADAVASGVTYRGEVRVRTDSDNWDQGYLLTYSFTIE